MSATAYLIRLDWPPALLSPNARAHWSRRAKAAKRYRADCCYTAQAAGCRALSASRLSVEATFHPPDARRRDLDNMLSALKSGLDGVADACGVDDSAWTVQIERGDPIKGGCVMLHVKPQVQEWQAVGDVAARMVKGAAE